MVRKILNHIYIIWLLVIISSLILSPESILISTGYILAPFLILYSSLAPSRAPNIVIFETGANLSGTQTIFVVLILMSTLICLYKFILSMIKKVQKK